MSSEMLISAEQEIKKRITRKPQGMVLKIKNKKFFRKIYVVG